MATWRRRDLERRSGERSRRMGRVLRAETLLPVLALLLAGVALWQAMDAQSRAEVLAHDLSLANGQLHSLQGYSVAPSPHPMSEEGTASGPPLAPLAPMGPPPASPDARP